MAVPVVDVVDMVVVRHGQVTATRSVLVVVVAMGDVVELLTLVPMVAVLVVRAAIVDVVDVIAVRHRRVPTVGAVDVRVIDMDRMRHRATSSLSCPTPEMLAHE
jgi:hypothetical protein